MDLFLYACATDNMVLPSVNIPTLQHITHAPPALAFATGTLYG